MARLIISAPDGKRGILELTKPVIHRRPWQCQRSGAQRPQHRPLPRGGEAVAGGRRLVALEDDLRVVAQAESLGQTLAAASRFEPDVDDGANNNGYGTITSPGNDPYVITVGAMKPMGTPDRTDDLIATYSSKGPTSFDHFVKPDERS